MLTTITLYIFYIDVPEAIDHENDVSAQLVSLNGVNVTWRVPTNNNDPIIQYAIMFCARISSDNTDCSSTSFTSVPVADHDLVKVGENQLRYVYSELLAEKLYEVVIRAQNGIGEQMSPVFGNGLTFNSSFPDDGRVVNVSFIPTTSTIILTWKLPPLAIATANLNVSFNITYYSSADPANIMLGTVEYNSSQPELGFSANIGMADSPPHVFLIVARYINPNLLSSQAILTGVQTLTNGKILSHT